MFIFMYYPITFIIPHKTLQRNSQEESKIFFMMADARFTEVDTIQDAGQDHDQPTRVNDADIAEGDVQIVDINGYTMRHLAYISIFVLRVYMKFVQEAYPSRLRAIHIINCPSFLDRMMAMMKPFIREEVFQMVCTSHPRLYLLYLPPILDKISHRGHGQSVRGSAPGYVARGIWRQGGHNSWNQGALDASFERKNVSCKQ